MAPTPYPRGPAPRALLAALLAIAGVSATSPALAFFETSGDTHEADLRGFLRFASTTTLNPDEPALLYPHDNDAQSLMILRLLSNAYLGDQLSLELNAYQVLTSTTTFTLLDPPAYRSDALTWTWNHDAEATATAAVDRLALAVTTDHLRLTVGRQAISLAATYFFTPNDFFAPFSASDFFRAYKPGVDAARADVTVAEFTQLQVVGVMGYRPVEDGLDRPDLGRSAAVARVSTVLGDSELGVLGARTPFGYAVGADAQGTLFEWLGVRTEGHAFLPEDDLAAVEPEVAFTLEHLFESTLNVQWETFYHGAGTTDSERSLLSLQSADGPPQRYFGRLYTALGLSYELTPLLHASMIGLVNVLDPSAYTALYLLYSVSDEAELALTGSVPVGRPAEGFVARSEFGLYPSSLMADFRLTF